MRSQNAGNSLHWPNWALPEFTSLSWNFSFWFKWWGPWEPEAATFRWLFRSFDGGWLYNHFYIYLCLSFQVLNFLNRKILSFSPCFKGYLTWKRKKSYVLLKCFLKVLVGFFFFWISLFHKNHTLSENVLHWHILKEWRHEGWNCRLESPVSENEAQLKQPSLLFPY